MREIKNVNELEKGKVYVYKGYDTLYRNAIYEATVTGIYAHTVTLSIVIRQDSMEDLTIEPSKPYSWSVRKIDVGLSEHFFVEE